MLADNFTDDFSILPIADALGVEILGLDISQTMSTRTIKHLRDAFQTHHLLCFRDQHLTDQQLVTFSSLFGALEAFPEKDKTKGKQEVYHVANVSSDGEHLPEDDQRVIFQRNNGRWHTDSSYRDVPSLASIMYGLEVLPDDVEGGETAFSNMLEAFEKLPEKMKLRLEYLHQVHYYGDIRRIEPSMRPMSDDERDLLPPITHPVVRVHPDRDYRRSLFFTSNTSLEIGGMTLEEGRKLHAWLVEYVSQAEFCYYHRWKANDLVMWDNRVLLHKAMPYDFSKYRRVLRRTTVSGSGPVLGPFWPEVRAVS